MQRVPVPPFPPSRVERGPATHSSARHLLSGAVVYRLKAAKSSHAGAWSLWRREHLPAFVLGSSVGRRVSQKVAGQAARPMVAIARRRDAANRP
jgi:hypothetical protein